MLRGQQYPSHASSAGTAPRNQQGAAAAPLGQVLAPSTSELNIALKYPAKYSRPKVWTPDLQMLTILGTDTYRER